jgi:hypothetical protein
VSLAITAGQGVLWVNLANIALGVVVMVFLGVLALGVIRDFCGGWPKRTTTSLEDRP